MMRIRKAIPEDGLDFSRLLLLSAPYFPAIFGTGIEMSIAQIFRHRGNLFSFKHVYFAEIDGENAGMILSYSWRDKKRENLKTGILLFIKSGFKMLSNVQTFMKLNSTVGRLEDSQYYISNIAVYPQFRRGGIGKQLMSVVEHNAREIGAENMVLDVEYENSPAIRLYENLGYKGVEEFLVPLKNGRRLHFLRMVKKI